VSGKTYMYICIYIHTYIYIYMYIHKRKGLDDLFSNVFHEKDCQRNTVTRFFCIPLLLAACYSGYTCRLGHMLAHRSGAQHSPSPDADILSRKSHPSSLSTILSAAGFCLVRGRRHLPTRRRHLHKQNSQEISKFENQTDTSPHSLTSRFCFSNQPVNYPRVK